MQRANTLENTLVLGDTESKRRRGRQRMRWLNNITNSVGMNLSKLWEIVEERGAWHAIVYGVTKSQTWISDWATAATIHVFNDFVMDYSEGRFWYRCTLGWFSKNLVILLVTSVPFMSLSCFNAGKQVKFSLTAFYKWSLPLAIDCNISQLCVVLIDSTSEWKQCF